MIIDDNIFLLFSFPFCFISDWEVIKEICKGPPTKHMQHFKHTNRKRSAWRRERNEGKRPGTACMWEESVKADRESGRRTSQ